VPGYLAADAFDPDSTNEVHSPFFVFAAHFLQRWLFLLFVLCDTVCQIRWVIKPTFRKPYDVAAAVCGWLAWFLLFTCARWRFD